MLYNALMRRFLLIALAALGASVLGAMLTRRMPDSPIFLWGDWLALRHVENPGIAFSINLPHQALAVLIPLALLLCCYLAATSDDPIDHSAYGLIVGGGVGNMVDRMGDGTVTDVFQVGSFPVFNVADSCISVGIAILVVPELLKLLGRKPLLR